MALAQLPTPIQIDPVDANLVRLPQTDLLGGQVNYGPFKFGSKLYAVLDDENLGQVAIFSSLDDGATWGRLDAASEPAFSPRVSAQFIGSNIYLVYDPAGPGATVQVFDMNTDTYGAPSVGGPTLANDFFFVRQTGGDIYVYYSVVTGGTTQVVRYARFSGGVWDAPVAVSGTSVGTRRFDPCVIIDDNDRMHAFFNQALNPVSANNISLIYVPVSAAGVVGAPVTLYTSGATGATNLATGSGKYWGAEDQILFPYFDSSDGILQMLSGTPSSGAVWTTDTIINPLPTPFNPFVCLYVYVDITDGTAYLFYACSDGTPSVTVNLFYSENTGGGWSVPAVLYDLIALPPNAEANQVISEIAPAVLPNPGAAVIMNMVGAGGNIFAFFAGAGAGPVSITTNKRPVGGGVFFPRYINLTWLLSSIQRTELSPVSSFFAFPNAYDLCLSREMRLYDAIDRTKLACGAKPACFLVDERDWVEQVSSGSVAFNPVGTIPLPDPADGDVVIFSFHVPLGYDGIILGQFHGFTGDYTQASGDLAWRIKVDGRYLRDCGNMLVSIGSSRQLSPIAGGLQLRSDNVVEYIVAAPNTGGSLPLPGQGNIIAGLHGWIYPRGRR